MRSILSLFLLPLLALAAPAAEAEKKAEVVPDVVYGHKDGLALTMDVIKPAKPSGAAVLWIQSGGWYSHWVEPRLWLGVGKPFLDKGITLFIVRHGSAPKYTVPEAIADVRRAVRFVHLKAKDYHVDPDRLGVTGLSVAPVSQLLVTRMG